MIDAMNAGVAILEGREALSAYQGGAAGLSSRGPVRVSASLVGGCPNHRTILVQLLDGSGLPIKSFGAAEVEISADDMAHASSVGVTICSRPNLLSHDCRVHLLIEQGEGDQATRIERAVTLSYPILYEVFPVVG